MNILPKNDLRRVPWFMIFLTYLCLFPANLVKADHSPPNRIEVYIYGPVFAQLIDSQGRQAGRDLVTGNLLEDIPRSEVVIERTKKRIPGWTIQLPEPIQGEYRMILVATGPGGFVVDIDTVDSVGDLRNSQVFRRVKIGDTVEYILTYRGDPEEKTTLREIVVR